MKFTKKIKTLSVVMIISAVFTLSFLPTERFTVKIKKQIHLQYQL
jgi:hypothetical protein